MDGWDSFSKTHSFLGFVCTVNVKGSNRPISTSVREKLDGVKDELNWLESKISNLALDNE